MRGQIIRLDLEGLASNYVLTVILPCRSPTSIYGNYSATIPFGDLRTSD